jgi:predicted glycoside hydrolase/deacetylase ChbG (UPF0249 family)
MSGMKPAVLAIIACAVAGSTFRSAPSASPDGPIRLIVQADDLGVAHGIDVAAIDAYRRGIVRTVNVIVPAPWFPEAVEMVKENPDLDVGIHLDLTSEWSSVKWRPMTHAPSLVDARGYFFPMVWPNPKLPKGTSLKEATPDAGEVERELRAQIETAKAALPNVTYTWEHMGFGSLSPDIRAIVVRLTKEYGLVTPGPDIGVQMLRDVWSGTDAVDVRIEKLTATLEALGPGTWLMVDHAAIDTPETRALGHPGYEYVARDRSGVLAAWTSPKVMEVVKRRGITLTNYRQLPHPL